MCLRVLHAHLALLAEVCGHESKRQQLRKWHRITVANTNSQIFLFMMLERRARE